MDFILLLLLTPPFYPLVTRVSFLHSFGLRPRIHILLVTLTNYYRCYCRFTDSILPHSSHSFNRIHITPSRHLPYLVHVSCHISSKPVDDFLRLPHTPYHLFITVHYSSIHYHCTWSGRGFERFLVTITIIISDSDICFSKITFS